MNSLRKHFGHPESSTFHGGARRMTIRDSPVVVLAGDKDDAKTFFFSRTLKLTQGYLKVSFCQSYLCLLWSTYFDFLSIVQLFSGLPSEVTPSAIMDQDKADQMFFEHLKFAIRGERLAKLAPLMCDDTIRAVKAIPDWSKGSGTIDPKALTFPVSTHQPLPQNQNG